MATIESLLRKPKVSDEQKVRQCRQAILSNRRSFEELLNAVLHPDPSVRISAARIIDAITEEDPTVAFEYKNSLIYKMAKVEQSEIRRHIAAVIPRLELSEREYIDVAAIYADYLSSRDKSVRDICLQAIDLFLDMTYPEDSKLAQKFLTQLKALKQRHGPQPEIPAAKPAPQAAPQPAAVTPPQASAPKPTAVPATPSLVSVNSSPAPAPSAGAFAPKPAAPAGFAPKAAATQSAAPQQAVRQTEPQPLAAAAPEPLTAQASAPTAVIAAPLASPTVPASAIPQKADVSSGISQETPPVSAPETATKQEGAKQPSVAVSEQPLQAASATAKDQAS